MTEPGALRLVGKMFVEVSLPTKIMDFYPMKITHYTVFM